MPGETSRSYPGRCDGQPLLPPWVEEKVKDQPWYQEALAAQQAQQVKKYRWLELGGRYVYSAKIGKGDNSRRGHECVVLVLPVPGCIGNVRVQFDDGHTTVCPCGVLKKIKAAG